MSFFKEALRPKHKMTVRKSAHKRSGRQRIYLSGFIQPSKSFARKGKRGGFLGFARIPAMKKQKVVRRVAGKHQTIIVRRQPLLAPPIRQTAKRQYTYGLSDFIQAPPRQQVMRQPVAKRTVMQTQQPQRVQHQSFASRGIDDLIQPSAQQQQQQGGRGDFIAPPAQQQGGIGQKFEGLIQPSPEVAQRQAQTRQNLGQAGQNLYKGARTVGESLYGGAKFAYGKAEELYRKVRPPKPTNETIEPAEQQESVEPTGSEEYEAEEFAEETTHPTEYKSKYY